MYAPVLYFLDSNVCLLTSLAIMMCSMVTTSGATARFYWTRGNMEHMSRLPVLAAAGRAARYHLGSIALGSFIIALIQLVR